MEHFYQSIPGWFFHQELFADKISQLPEQGRIVEVGSWKGRSAAFIAVEAINQDRGITLTCIDTFKGSNEREHKQDEDVKNGTLLEAFERNTKPVAHVLNALPAESLEAASWFEDESLDLVYIDASHEYGDVMDDLNAWWPKVKPGGHLIGDDYTWAAVAQAALDFSNQNNLKLQTYGGPPAYIFTK